MRYGLLFTGLLASSPAVAWAQVVRGEVVELGTGAPVAGAMVILQELDGEPVRRVLTDAAGAFVLSAPHPGRFRIRVDRIGYESVDTEAFDVPVAGTYRAIDVPVRPIELEGLDVAGTRRCEVRPEEGRVIAQVWEEARKALQAAAWTQESGVYRYTLLHYVRDLDRDAERIESEERRFMSGHTEAPFVSAPAEELAAEGYVRQEGDSTLLFLAPDAEAFLSDGFLDTHCLGVRPGEGGLIGLTFEPVVGRTLPEIAGVLWIDAATALLRRLEFTYVNLGRRERYGEASGEVVFTALPNGTWIVREFRIRMPAVSGGRRPRRVGYRDEGGIAWRLTSDSGEIVLDATTATISGTLADSAGRPPSPPALLRVADVGEEQRTRDDGSFLLSGLPEGLLRVDLHHPSLESLGLPAPYAEVEGAYGEITPLHMRLPTPADAVLHACRIAGAADDATPLLGRVLGSGAGAAEGAEVEIAWLAEPAALPPPPPAPDVASGRPWAAGRSGAYATLKTTTDPRGIFILCDVPDAAAFRVRASRPGGARSVRWVPRPRGVPVATITLTLHDEGGR